MRNAEFEKFIQLAGGVEAATGVLGCSAILVRSIRNGHRDVSKQMARQAIEAFPGELSLTKLLYPDGVLRG